MQNIMIQVIIDYSALLVLSSWRVVGTIIFTRSRIIASYTGNGTWRKYVYSLPKSIEIYLAETQRRKSNEPCTLGSMLLDHRCDQLYTCTL